MTEPSYVISPEAFREMVVMAQPGVRTAENMVEPEPPMEPKPKPKPRPDPKGSKATKAQLLKLIEQMQRDWVQLNAFLNATASYHDWCSEYEERLRRYNDYFEVLKLEGREGLWGMGWDDRQTVRYLLPPAELERLRVPRGLNSPPRRRRL